MDNCTTDVENYQSDNNRIEHADNRNGELDDVFQTEVCYYQAESRDEEYQSLVLYTIIAKLGEITGDSSCQADAGGEAGKENNQGQDNLTAEAHVIGTDFAEQSCTIGDNTENIDAQCAGVSQCCIDDSKEEGCNQAGIRAELGQNLFIGNALSFYSLDGNGAEQDCCQKVHGIIAFLEAAEERRCSEVRIRHFQAAGRIYENADHENCQTNQKHGGQKFTDMTDNF